MKHPWMTKEGRQAAREKIKAWAPFIAGDDDFKERGWDEEMKQESDSDLALLDWIDELEARAEKVVDAFAK